jgi:hypothetical protein
MIGTIVLLGLSNISDKHERRTRNVLKKKVLIKLRKDTQVRKNCHILGVHEFVHCDKTMKVTKKMQLYRLTFKNLAPYI